MKKRPTMELVTVRRWQRSVAAEGRWGSLTKCEVTECMTDRRIHNGPSRVFILKHLNSLNMGTWTTSLNFMKNLQDGPSQSRRTVVVSATPHLVRLPHLPSATALCCSSLKISCSFFYVLIFVDTSKLCYEPCF